MMGLWQMTEHSKSIKMKVSECVGDSYSDKIEIEGVSLNK